MIACFLSCFLQNSLIILLHVKRTFKQTIKNLCLFSERHKRVQFSARSLASNKGIERTTASYVGADLLIDINQEWTDSKFSTVVCVLVLIPDTIGWEILKMEINKEEHLQIQFPWKMFICCQSVLIMQWTNVGHSNGNSNIDKEVPMPLFFEQNITRCHPEHYLFSWSSWSFAQVGVHSF